MAPVHNFNEAARYGIHYNVQYSLAYHSTSLYFLCEAPTVGTYIPLL